jgi:hypothetical protein
VSKYEKIKERREAIEPWVDFILDADGAELHDQVSALDHAISASLSANDFDAASAVLDVLYQSLKKLQESDGFDELVKYADESYDYYLKDYSEEKKAELCKSHPRPSEKAKTLPQL